MLQTVSERVPIEKLALHFHDTYGQALANILACLDLGVRCLTPRLQVLVAAPMPKARRAILPPKT